MKDVDKPVTTLNRFRGCLLGGAVGDALGAPVEFETLAAIRARFGPAGIDEMVDGAWPRGAITDDTQMSLFTAEGLLRADVRGSLKGVCYPPDCVRNAYTRWLLTQADPVDKRRLEEFHVDGWLISVPELFARRAPGNTCVTSLRSERFGTVEEPLNHSKGCGGVMRAAPAGLMSQPWGDHGDSFHRGAELAALTHGHPSGYLAAGCLALIIERLRGGDTLHIAVDTALKRLDQEPNHHETSAALAAALQLAAESEPPTAERVETLGAGWVAEETLGIAVYAVAATTTFRDAVVLAVNHSGDSDSTGAIAGNLAGTIYGAHAIPHQWLGTLELRNVISQIADDLYRCSQGPPAWDPETMWEKYPGW
jgi:ADP-ribosylglycohydrolase